MATFFLRIRSRFSCKLNKISWELPFFWFFFSSLFVSQAVSIEILAKNDTLNVTCACFVILCYCLLKKYIFWSKWLKIGNFFEWWSPDGPQWSLFDWAHLGDLFEEVIGFQLFLVKENHILLKVIGFGDLLGPIFEEVIDF